MLGLSIVSAQAQTMGGAPRYQSPQFYMTAPSSVLRALDPKLQQIINSSYNAAAYIEQPKSSNTAVSSPVDTSALQDHVNGVISSTTSFPWRYVGFLQIHLSGNEYKTCTGTLLSPHVVITAAHCLYDEKQGYLNEVEFVPGRNAGLAPFGTFKAARTVLLTPIKGKLNSNFDLAFVILEKSPFEDRGKERFIPVGVVDSAHFKPEALPMSLIAAGYPTDLGRRENPGVLTVAATTRYRNPITPGMENQFEHKASTEQGTSGGPIFAYHPVYNQFALVGIISMERTWLDANNGNPTDSWAVGIKINAYTQRAIQTALKDYEPNTGK